MSDQWVVPVTLYKAGAASWLPASLRQYFKFEVGEMIVSPDTPLQTLVNNALREAAEYTGEPYERVVLHSRAELPPDTVSADHRLEPPSEYELASDARTVLADKALALFVSVDTHAKAAADDDVFLVPVTLYRMTAFSVFERRPSALTVVTTGFMRVSSDMTACAAVYEAMRVATEHSGVVYDRVYVYKHEFGRKYSAPGGTSCFQPPPLVDQKREIVDKLALTTITAREHFFRSGIALVPSVDDRAERPLQFNLSAPTARPLAAHASLHASITKDPADFFADTAQPFWRVPVAVYHVTETNPVAIKRAHIMQFHVPETMGVQEFKDFVVSTVSKRTGKIYASPWLVEEDHRLDDTYPVVPRSIFFLPSPYHTVEDARSRLSYTAVVLIERGAPESEEALHRLKYPAFDIGVWVDTELTMDQHAERTRAIGSGVPVDGGQISCHPAKVASAFNKGSADSPWFLPVTRYGGAYRGMNGNIHPHEKIVTTQMQVDSNMTLHDAIKKAIRDAKAASLVKYSKVMLYNRHMPPPAITGNRFETPSEKMMQLNARETLRTKAFAVLPELPIFGDIGVWQDVISHPPALDLSLEAGCAVVAILRQEFPMPNTPPEMRTSSAPVVTVLQIARLIKKIDDEFVAKSSTDTDFKVDVSRDFLVECVGQKVFEYITHMAGPPTSKLKFTLRRTVPTNKFIAFHTDVAKRTVQIPLTGDDDIQGGKLIFLQDDGKVIHASRRPGVPIVHDGCHIHGVTRHTHGIRYGLYILNT